VQTNEVYPDVRQALTQEQAAARPSPSQGQALSQPHRPPPPKKVDVRDRVWALGCARHHAGCVSPWAANHLIEINSIITGTHATSAGHASAAGDLAP
jgi:hypothetical protein